MLLKAAVHAELDKAISPWLLPHNPRHGQANTLVTLILSHCQSHYEDQWPIDVSVASKPFSEDIITLLSDAYVKRSYAEVRELRAPPKRFHTCLC
jgi:hypothetical protein